MELYITEEVKHCRYFCPCNWLSDL